MSGVTLEGLDDAQRALAELALRAADLRPVLRPNGQALTDAIKASVAAGRSPDDIAWPPIVRANSRRRGRRTDTPGGKVAGVKTGRMLASYRVRVTKDSLEIVNAAPHAHFLQYGTERGGQLRRTVVRSATTRTSRSTGRTYTRTQTRRTQTRTAGVQHVAPRHILPSGGPLQEQWLDALKAELLRYVTEGSGAQAAT